MNGISLQNINDGILGKIASRILENDSARISSFGDSFLIPQRVETLRQFDVRNGGFFLIAEIKRASPSKGILTENPDISSLARDYEAGGARAVSVVTERFFFGGDSDYLRTARASVGIPVLRKDFLLHPLHVADSFAMGADAVLLIASCLPGGLFGEMIAYAHALGMAVLVEARNAREIDDASRCFPDAIGINNRNLSDFTVDVNRSIELISCIPESIPAISESGIFTREDIERLSAAGFDGALVGEALVKSPDPKRAAAMLLGGTV